MRLLLSDRARVFSTNEIFLAQKASHNEKSSTFAAAKSKDDSVAQQVEHNTFNVGVLGSSPSRVTKRNKKSLIDSRLGIFRFCIPPVFPQSYEQLCF